MIRLLLVFLVLFAAAALGIALLPASPPPTPVAASVANEPHDQARQTVAPSDVRVVYPAPGASATPAPPPPAAVTASVPPPPAAAAPLDPHVAESVVPAAAAPPADAAAPVPAAGVNLNTASIEALNGLGGGHIGRTIASHRPYGSVEELLTRRVIRKSVYDQIKDRVATQ